MYITENTSDSRTTLITLVDLLYIEVSFFYLNRSSCGYWVCKTIYFSCKIALDTLHDWHIEVSVHSPLGSLGDLMICLPFIPHDTSHSLTWMWWQTNPSRGHLWRGLQCHRRLVCNLVLRLLSGYHSTKPCVPRPHLACTWPLDFIDWLRELL